MLKLKNVSKYYYQDGVVAKGLSNVNLELHLGEFVVITGESGSGKSTLLNVLSGLDTYEDGEETSHYTEEDYLNYRRNYVSNIFQNFNLVNSYTVFENIELAFLMNGYKRSDIKDKVNDLINKVGLKKYKNTHASKLSGGEKQRVAIARALANNTPIIVADEPTGSLDSIASQKVLDILHDISKEKLVIIVTHNKNEVLKYATRLIKMHDGRVLENKIIENINLDQNLKSIDVKDITWFNKIKLGFRNAFNLPIKFLLMVAIFLLIIVNLITNYGSFKKSEYEEVKGYSNIFNNISDKRIIINKKNKKSFDQNDYDKITNIKGIDYLVIDDVLNEYNLNLEGDYIYLNGNLYLKEINNVSKGKIPENDNEIVIIGNKENYYLKENELLNKEFIISDLNQKVKIVGLLYDDNYNEYNIDFFVNDELKNNILLNTMKYYNNITYQINNVTYYDLNVIPNSNVNKGEVYISEYVNNIFTNCLNKKLDIKIENIYYNENLSFNIKEIYDNNNIHKLLNIDEKENDFNIYINYEDYNNLFNKGNYQSSVFVKDIKDLENVISDLEKMDLNVLSLRNAKIDETEMISSLYNIFKLIVTIVLVVTMFFITYFIIRIIYKSRNSYYTTLRTLGSSKKVCISILMNELIILASFTYVLFIAFVILIKTNIINYEYFKNIIKYVYIKDYLIVYLILIIMAILISFRYGRKIFKDSVIKTYKETI